HEVAEELLEERILRKAERAPLDDLLGRHVDDGRARLLDGVDDEAPPRGIGLGPARRRVSGREEEDRQERRRRRHRSLLGASPSPSASARVKSIWRRSIATPATTTRTGSPSRNRRPVRRPRRLC